MPGDDLIVFVTELARRQFVRREVLRRGFVDTSRFLTFTRLREGLVDAARRAELLPAPVLTDVRRRVLVHRAAEQAKSAFTREPLSILSVSALADTLDELIENLSPFGDDGQEMLDWLIGQPKDSKLRQLGELYHAYRELLAAAGFADTRDSNAAVLKLLGGDPQNWPSILKTLKGRLAFRSVRWLNPFEEKLVLSLKQRFGDERVAVYSALPPAHAEKTEDRLGARIRSEVMMGAEEAWTAWAEGLTDAIEVEDAALAVDSRDRVSFSRSVGLYGEVEDIGRRIRWEIEHQKIAPERIALVVRNLSDYADAITNVFERFGIPCFFRRGLPASSLPLVKTLLSLLSLPLTMDRDRFCALLQSPGLRWKGLESEDERRQLAHNILAAGVGPRLAPDHVRQQLEMYYSTSGALPPSPGGFGGQGGQRALPSVVQHLNSLRSLAAAAPLAEHAKAALKIAADFGFEGALDHAGTPLPFRISNLRAIEATLEIIREIEEATRGDRRERSLAEFTDLLEESLENATVSPGGSEESGVWVLNPFDTAGLQFDLVLIAGLNEGAFPAIPRQDSLFSDDERKAIREAMAKRKIELPQWALPLSTLRLLQEGVLFLITVGAARERLVLSYQACTTDGKDLVPSDFFRSLWNLAGWPAPEKIRINDYDAWRIQQLGKDSYLARHAAKQMLAPPYQRTPMPGESYLATVPLPLCRAADEARQRVARSTEDKSIAPELAALAGPSSSSIPHSAFRTPHSLAARLAVELAREWFFNTPAEQRAGPEPYCGKLKGEGVRRIAADWLKSRDEFSATALEALAKCRYRFLMSQVLRLGPVRTQEDMPDVMDRGQVIHRILEHTYKALAGDTALIAKLDPALEKRFGALCRAKAWAREEKPGHWQLVTPIEAGQADREPKEGRFFPLVVFDPAEEAKYVEFARAVADAFFRHAEQAGEGFRLGDPGVWATEKPKIRQIVANYVLLDAESAAAEPRYPALFELKFGRQPRGDGAPGPTPPKQPLRLRRLDGRALPTPDDEAQEVGRGRRTRLSEVSVPDCPALELRSGEFRVAVHGQVDRVDLLFDEEGRLSRLLVIDYKTPGRGGLAEKKYAREIAENLDCQLPIYGLVAQQYFFGRHNEDELNAMTEVLYHIQEREFSEMQKQFEKKRVHMDFKTDEGQLLTRLFVERLQNNLGRLGDADFSVDPLDCEYCDFKHVCRVDVNALAPLGAGLAGAGGERA